MIKVIQAEGESKFNELLQQTDGRVIAETFKHNTLELKPYPPKHYFSVLVEYNEDGKML